MAEYTKMWAALISGVAGFLVVTFALPAEWVSPELQAAVTTILSTVSVWWVKNAPPVA